MNEPRPTLDLEHLGFDRGAQVLLARATRALAPGALLEVCGSAPALGVELAAWARANGHAARPLTDRRWTLEIGRSAGARRAGAERAGLPEEPASRAPQCWGLAARGALVEAGGPEFGFRLCEREELWTADEATLYRQALAAQWDPERAIPWSAPLEHSDELEDALVEVLTFLIENETAALLVPARFAGQTHPHFRETLQLLAIQAADEARHIEVFTRRATLRGRALGLSTVGGRASLKSLVDEPDFARAALLTSVLGEGTFTNLLGFLHAHAPDRCTAEIMRLAAQDEARHVAFAMSHLAHHAQADATLLARLASAVHQRHAALLATSGLSVEVFDALIALAGGSYQPRAIERGHAAVVELLAQMDAGRRMRLRKLGFDARQAEQLSELHTRNFM
ncbi:MAG: ferritin-like domain-containing protein [Planctomycetes bacterium]|nr:ferritin-like domain-containing protein [Planctomycetota bacterium]